MTLKDLQIAESGRVTVVGGEGALRRHFLDMGIIPGVVITLEKYAPMGDPMEFSIHGYKLTLRLADAERIQVKRLTAEEQAAHFARKAEFNKSLLDETVELYGNGTHPGLGEGGRYHDRASETPLPDGTLLSFALAGNQNSGKTTLFNQLTGSNQHVGNFPGLTMDKKSGQIKKHPNTEITDLPGIYSLSPYSAEEMVSRCFILEEQPAAIINIVDVTNIERNLILTLQLMELERPMVLALNMMDEFSGNGGSVDINTMEQLLGIPVVAISAVKNQGVDELVAHAIHVAKYREYTGRIDFCKADELGGAVHRCIHGIIHLIQDHAEEAGIPVRFAATKLVEGDPFVEESLNLDQNEKETVEHIIRQMEEERGLDRVAAIADMRYEFIERLCAITFVKPHESKEEKRSEKIDKILTGKYTALPVFIMIMALIFRLTFNVVGVFLQRMLEKGVEALTVITDGALGAWGVNPALHSLVIDGIFGGVGSVVSFVPIIITLFFFLSMLEDSGYMARIAFVMDKLLRKIGLSGRSVVPMIIGFGCSVPAIMATRTLPSKRDRRMTIMLTPFMSCTAKLPIYIFFANAFFPDRVGIITVILYVLGIAVGILVSIIAKHTCYKGEAVPFVMELPNYRMPSFKNVIMLLWGKTKDFLQKAFTIILLASMAVWFLQSFDFRLNPVEDSAYSMLASISGLLAPLLAPLGFGKWQFVTALISGFLAKESVVSSLNVLFPTREALFAVLSPSGAAAFLVFSLLYAPCVATIATVKKEQGYGGAVRMLVFQCAVAWVAAFIVNLIF